MTRQLGALVAAVLAVAAGMPAPAAQSRAVVPPDMAARAAAGQIVDVIVGVRAGFIPEGRLPSAAAVARQRRVVQQQVARVTAAAAANGAAVGKRFAYIPYFVARVNRAALDALRAMPDVASVEEVTRDRATLAQSTQIVSASAAWSAGATGMGWTVAVLDTGVQKGHPFLAGSVVAEACFSGGIGDTSVCPGGAQTSLASGSGEPCPIAGCEHGTHVAGIVTGVNGPGGSRGVAPDAAVIAIQVFTRTDDVDFCEGVTPCIYTSSVDQIDALNHVFTLAGPNNVNRIAAVNMSLGGGRFFTTLSCDGANMSRKAAIDNLRSIGIATVVASGNDGFGDSLNAPGCISSAVSVGSTTKSNGMSGFGNRASFLSLLGPGSSITSSVTGNAFAVFSGTSMAAPHVAGAWAVLKQAAPAAGVSTVLAHLRTTGAAISDSLSGFAFPRINVNAARLALAGGGHPPGAPTGFSATVSGTTVSMFWSPPVSGGTPTGYTLVARQVPGGPVLTTVPVGAVTAVAVDAPHGSFSVSVVASNGSGTGPESNAVSIAVPTAVAPPGAPANLAVSVTGTTASFTWQAPVSGGPVAAYVLVAGTTPGFTSVIASLPLAATSTAVAVPGVPPGTYFVRLHAQNSGGLGPSSNEVMVAVAAPQPPGAPTLHPPIVSGNDVTLSWSAGGGGAPTSYLLRAAGSPGGPAIVTVPLGGTSAGFADVPPGTYFLTLFALNAVGPSPPSAEVQLVVP